MLAATNELTKKIDFKSLYGSDEAILSHQEVRYQTLIADFEKHFSMQPEAIFSSPGRTELSGNHTDHNNGMVIAAAVNMDIIACVSKNQNEILIYSEGYEESFRVDLQDLKVHENEKGTTAALIRGIAKKLDELGFVIGGFHAVMSSDVKQGSGLSSSAAVEVLIGTIFNHLYNNGIIDSTIIAKIGQYAENVYFGKPCGLMDQLACATGGIIGIDFENSDEPAITSIDFEFDKVDYALVVLHTGGSHINLTEDYASIPGEMKAIAAFFAKNNLRQVEYSEFQKHIPELRGCVHDRAILRSLHFFNENIRVTKQIKALQNNDFISFLELVQQSGDSSFKYLQNIYSTSESDYQPVSLALALTEEFIQNVGAGACRIHGGGFAGTIQAFIPKEELSAYYSIMSGVFGEQSVQELSIRRKGACCVWKGKD